MNCHGFSKKEELRMNFKHKQMIGLMVLALAVLALFVVIAYTTEAQTNWPKGENSGKPDNANDAMVVDGSDGDKEWDTPPEGPQILMAVWYNATGDDWVIENGDDIYRKNQSIDMKEYNVVIETGGRLKLENMSLANATSVIINPGAELVLSGGDTEMVAIDTQYVMVAGTLTVEDFDDAKAKFTGLGEEGMAFLSAGNVEDIEVTPTEDGIGALVVTDVTIEDSIFNSAVGGIAMLVMDADPTIDGNMFRGGGQPGEVGLVFVDIDGFTLTGCTFDNIRNHAIAAMDSTLTITGNTFTDMEYGPQGDGAYEEYIIYIFGAEPTNKNTIIDDNTWTKNGDSGKLFMQTYNLTVTVKDEDSGEELEGVQVKLEGQYADTSREDYTNEDGEVYLECTEYYIYGSPTGYATRDAVEGGNPYDLYADDGANEKHIDFDETGKAAERELPLKQLSYDFEPINFKVVTDFTGDAVFVDEQLTLSCDVKNNGNKDAKGVKIGFYLDDGTRADVFLGEDVIDIDAEDQNSAEYIYAMPDTYANMDIDFKVVANFDGGFVDYDDTNDEAMKTTQHVNTKPVVDFESPADKEELTAFSDITGTVTDADGVDAVGVKVKIGAEDWADATVDAGTWTYSGWTAEFNGNLTIKAKAQDEKTLKGSGFNVEGDEATVTAVMKVPSTIEFEVGTPDLIWGNTTSEYTLEGTVTPPGSNTIDTVTVKVDDGAEEAANYDAGDWSYLWDELNSLPADGEYMITVTATDNHGVVSTETKTILVHVDNTATDPVLSFTTAQGETMVGDSKLIEGTVIEDYELTSLEYKAEGETTWTELADNFIVTVGNTSTWTVTVKKSDFTIQDGKETYIVYFRASDAQETTVETPFQVKIPAGPTGINLFLKKDECSVDSTSLKQNQAVSVSYTVHKDGSGTAEATIKFFIGDALVATEDVEMDVSEKQLIETFKPSSAHVDKKDIKIEISFLNDEDTTDNVVTLTTDKVKAEEKPDDDDDDGPGFELGVFVAAALVAMVLVARRKD